jgi:hypothetical protein
MKILDKAVIILISIALIIAAGVGPAIALASSEGYYHRQFAKNGIYSDLYKLQFRANSDM